MARKWNQVAFVIPQLLLITTIPAEEKGKIEYGFKVAI